MFRIILLGTALAFIAFTASACCNKIQEDADALVDKQLKCAAGDTCVIVRYWESVGPNNCLGAFQCNQALNERGLSAFLNEAREMVDDFKHCNQCTMADCDVLDPNNTSAVCNTTTGTCEAVHVDP